MPQAPDSQDGIVGVSHDSTFEMPVEQPIADPVTTILEEDQVLSSSKEEEVVVADELKAVDAEVSVVAVDSLASATRRVACPSFCSGTSYN